MNAINIGGGVAPSVESMISWCKNAEQAQSAGLRTDSRRSSKPVTAARSSIRQWAIETATQAAFDLKRLRNISTDSARIEEFALDLIAATASGLGMREQGGTIQCDSLRTDASWFAPGALNSEGPIIQPAYQPRVISASIPTRTIESWAQTYDSTALSYAGKVAEYKPGMTNVPRADVQTGPIIKRQVYSWVTSTAIDFMELMLASNSQISVVEDKSRAAMIAFAEFKEQALVNGVAGTDYLGLTQIGVTRYHSNVDFSSPATTMGAKYDDLLNMAYSIRETAGFRQGGASTNAMMLGSRLAHLIRRTNNFDAGGSGSGMDMLEAVMKANAAAGQVFQNMGITKIMEAPNLDGFNGDADRSAVLFFDANNTEALAQVTAMTPAPVRTFQSLTGNETLYLARDAGLDVRNALPIGIATVKTA